MIETKFDRFTEDIKKLQKGSLVLVGANKDSYFSNQCFLYSAIDSILNAGNKIYIQSKPGRNSYISKKLLLGCVDKNLLNFNDGFLEQMLARIEFLKNKEIIVDTTSESLKEVKEKIKHAQPDFIFAYDFFDTFDLSKTPQFEQSVFEEYKKIAQECGAVVLFDLYSADENNLDEMINFGINTSTTDMVLVIDKDVITSKK